MRAPSWAILAIRETLRIALAARPHWCGGRAPGGSVTLALATAIDHLLPGRAVVYDSKGNGLVFYKSLPR